MENREKPLGKFIRRKDCRFCGSTDLTTILDFGDVPLAGGFLKREDFREEKFYPLTLNFCEKCFLVQVSNVVPGEVLFKNYFYFSSAIKTLVDHLAEFAGETYARFLKDRPASSVFEIGCNDGVMLKPFAALGMRSIGIDPATNVINSITDKNITVINDFFSGAAAEKIKNDFGRFDAIVSSYSFAHIDDMRSVMRGVATLLKEDGVFIFEVYYLGTLIEEMQYDMIYHEHMSYYSLKSLSLFLQMYGMEVFDVKFTPGVRSGAVRFYARFAGKRSEPVSESVKQIMGNESLHGYDKAATFTKYAVKVNRTKEQLIALLEQLKKEKRTIIGYGASGRGTTIMNYCGIDTRYLDYVVDDAPAKHGFFTPGTHVPIQPWEFTQRSKFPDHALLFAWSFIDEVKKRRADYLQMGGKFIVPLPEVRIVSK